jgi:hypothetical protein
MKFNFVHDIPPKDNAAPTAFQTKFGAALGRSHPALYSMQYQCVSIMRQFAKPNSDFIAPPSLSPLAARVFSQKLAPNSGDIFN